MSNAIALRPHGTAINNWTSKQLDTIKQTVARDTNPTEFDLFIEYAKVKGLDPFSKQVIAIVFNKDKPTKRQMTIITTQEGLRVMAARCGDYRPAETEPAFEYDEGKKSPTNPLGIVKCTTTLWKQDNKGDWHKVNGWAYWDEFAAVKEAWAEDENGKWRPSGKITLEGNWGKMGRIMIAKCATMQALRAGWPEVFGGVYAEEELDRAKVIDLTASEMVEQQRVADQKRHVGMLSGEVPFVDDGGTLVYVSGGQFADHLIKLAGAYTDKTQLESMRIRNREGLRRFWAEHKPDAMDLNGELENIAAGLPPAPAKPLETIKA